MKRSNTDPRVAIIIESMNSGGAERAALDVAASASRLTCVVVAERATGDIAPANEAAEIEIASRAEGRRGRAERIYRLTGVLHRIRPDAVVTMLSPIVPVIAARTIGVPVMQWIQAPWSRTTGGFGSSRSARARRAGLQLAARFSRVVAGATPGLLEECTELGIARTKLALLPNGLTLPPFEPLAERSAQYHQLLTVGRLEPQKRHDILLEAIAELHRDGISVRLTLIGTGRDHDELRAHATRLGISEFVRFAGYLAKPFRDSGPADVFVLSTDHEGFGNVLVEALARGLPIVVSDVPYGPRFILRDGDFGELVTPDSPAALAAGIKHVVSRLPLNEQERRRLRRRAESFSISCVAARFEELITEAVVKRSAGPLPRAWE